MEKYQWLNPKSLKQNPRNPNKHSPEQIDRLALLIEAYGWRHPIIVSNQTGLIVVGHGRLEYALKKGLEAVPVEYQDFKDEDEEFGFMVADNAIADWAELDLAQINLIIPDLGPDYDVDLLGIKDFVLEPADKYGDQDADAVPESRATDIKPGDLFTLGAHRLLCGDATHLTHVEALMNGEKADMVFTDPPYGVSYQKKCDEIANQSKSRLTSKIEGDDLSVEDLKKVINSAFANIDHVLADKSCYYVCSPQGGELGLMMMMMMMENNIPCRHMIIWVKNAPVFSMGRLDYDYKHEPILFGWSPNRTHHKSKQAGTWNSSVWDLAREQNKLHPTMKPVDLMVNAIQNSCPVDGRVFDPFSGSGSTLIACEKTNRKCFGMEIDPQYCQVIIDRWEKFTGQKAVKIESNENKTTEKHAI